MLLLQSANFGGSYAYGTLQPQNVRHDLEMVWTNLLGCCESQNVKGHKFQTQCHCGEYRGSRPVGVSPLDPTCETQFKYTLRGDIEPSPFGNKAARLAISNLNFRAERLRRSRESLIAAAYSDIEALIPGARMIDSSVLPPVMPAPAGMHDMPSLEPKK
jgi:hypothetical protein